MLCKMHWNLHFIYQQAIDVSWVFYAKYLAACMPSFAIIEGLYAVNILTAYSIPSFDWLFKASFSQSMNEGLANLHVNLAKRPTKYCLYAFICNWRPIGGQYRQSFAYMPSFAIEGL